MNGKIMFKRCSLQLQVFLLLMVYASYGCNPQFLKITEIKYRPPGKNPQDIQ